jgi:hypothetical protein
MSEVAYAEAPAVITVGRVSSRTRRPGRSQAARLGTSLAAGGGICIVASMLIAFLVADHSSSDSSPSSLIAIGLGSIGVALVLLGSALLAVLSAGQLWRWVRRGSHGGFGGRRTP